MLKHVDLFPQINETITIVHWNILTKWEFFLFQQNSDNQVNKINITQ